MKKKIELDNLQWLLDNHGMSLEHGNTVIGVDYLDVESDGIDLVVYDVDGLDFNGGRIKNYKELVAYCDETGRDEEIYEFERVTLVKR